MQRCCEHVQFEILSTIVNLVFECENNVSSCRNRYIADVAVSVKPEKRGRRCCSLRQSIKNDQLKKDNLRLTFTLTKIGIKNYSQFHRAIRWRM